MSKEESMTNDEMMKILENPQSYTIAERLSAAKVALVLLDSFAVSDGEKRVDEKCLNSRDDKLNSNPRPPRSLGG